jgi:hypothetical protein
LGMAISSILSTWPSSQLFTAIKYFVPEIRCLLPDYFRMITVNE